ncbi:family 78 glycoside hydrolase catalytic domain [Halorarum halobium]|uniref:family 78 glycoside hydrolase catalytic domain n=1 Tax=Halorarum halobium TaxID=3075121 RepID=UPI0028AF3450|nr:family 78 glycoside hydrolase catalytic domain [Halobaculum sp. XH14]
MYDGVPLEADSDYYWRVRIWDEDDRPSKWSDLSSFSTALSGEHEWDGEWISYQPGAGDSNGYRSRWHPATKDPEEWVQVDLGESRPITRIELHPASPCDGPETPDGVVVSNVYSIDDDLESGPRGFGFPVRYRIEVSDDETFAQSSVVVDRTEEAQANPGTDSRSFDVNTTARYVRVVATDLYTFDPATPPRDRFGQLRTEFAPEAYGSWQTFALAGLGVYNGGETDVAADRPVTASSSVEREGWGRSNLVDGWYASRTAAASPLFRTDVALDGDVVRARAHVCTLGYGELYANGERVGNEVLNPGWTEYDERALYSTYDLSEHLEAGENALGLWLGRGWFSKNAQGWTGFGSPRALLHLTLEYADGSTRTIGTDESWTATESPIVEHDLYDGERYDARLEQPGWTEPDFDGEWEYATVVEGPDGELTPQRLPPIRVTEQIDPVEVHDHEKGPIFDFGQNLVGWVAINVHGADAGDEITIRHAETLLDDGSLAMGDLRTADATDTYVAADSSRATYRPRFTYHGFRYVQVSNYPGDLSTDDLRAHVVHSDLDRIGSFDCSNTDLRQVQRNAMWGLRGNVHSVLTDCPQRDERFGWTGDNHIAGRSLMFNFDAALFYEKWMNDHADVQSDHGYVADTIPYGYGSTPEDPTWGITQVTIPWHLYRHYGDRGVLKRHYERMRRYVDYWDEQSNDGIIPDKYGKYGDWLAFENADGRRGLPFDLFNSAFHYHTTNLFAKIATTLGNEADAATYRRRAEHIADAINNEFFRADEARYGPGTQASYTVPLFVGLVPDEHVNDVATRLAETVRSDGCKLKTGFLGTRPLLHTLVDHGYEEIAYEVVSQPEQPGWVYMVRQGATTMWERWDSDSRIGSGMNSFNHSPFTFVSEYLYEAIAGLRLGDDPVTDHATVAPTLVDALDWAEGQVETPNGEFTVAWERTDSDRGYELSTTVPWNTTATVRLPGAADSLVTESGTRLAGTTGDVPDGIDAVRQEEGDLVVEVGSGTYQFAVESEQPSR